ncbi:hypothetical protein GGR57DRAFT_457636 [Xylariaceae sp. FL1272]|nr:hypothetical protein GGR57DRAFT_457636 [Xylariaceae sp. FL1272]
MVSTEFSEAAPATFPQFGRLPPELRMMIWEEAARVPRVVHLVERAMERTQSRTLTVKRVRQGLQTQIRRFSQVPELFFVNHEARAIALKEYTPVSFTLRLRIMNNKAICKFVDSARIHLHIKPTDTVAIYKNCAKLEDGWVARTNPFLNKVSTWAPMRNYLFVLSPHELKDKYKAIYAWITKKRANKLPFGVDGLHTTLQTLSTEPAYARPRSRTTRPSYDSSSVALDTQASPFSVPRFFDLEDLKAVRQQPPKEGEEPTNVVCSGDYYAHVVNMYKLE